MRRPSLEPVRHGVLVDHLGLGAEKKLNIANVLQHNHVIHRNLLSALSESPLPGIGRRDSVRGSESRDTIDGKIQIGVPRGSIVGLFRCLNHRSFNAGGWGSLKFSRRLFLLSLSSFFRSFSSFSPLLSFFLFLPFLFFLFRISFSSSEYIHTRTDFYFFGGRGLRRPQDMAGQHHCFFLIKETLRSLPFSGEAAEESFLRKRLFFQIKKILRKEKQKGVFGPFFISWVFCYFFIRSLASRNCRRRR